MSNFNVLDIIFMVVSAFVIIRATIRGFLDQVFSTVSLVGSFIIAILFYKDAAIFLLQFFDLKNFQPIIAFLILFLVTYLIVKIIQLFVSGILESATISSFDKALGFFLGVVKAFVIIFIVIFIFEKLPINAFDNLLRESYIARFIMGAAIILVKSR